MDENPLVSVPIITYNSAAYILNGLESLKNQTYKNFEVIVSDDCSTDNTIELVSKWLKDNESCFVRSKIITTDKNTGIAGNLNRAYTACSGSIIRGLSGDDMFLPNTLERYVYHFKQHPDWQIAFAKLHFIGSDKQLVEKTKEAYLKLYPKFLDEKKQYRNYLKGHFIPGTGLCFKKSLWERIGGFDERYQFCEEYPFNMAVLELGEVIHFIDEELYGYYVREDSLSNGQAPVWRNFRDQWRFTKDYKLKQMVKNGLVFQAWNQFVTFYCTETKYFSNTPKRRVLSFLLKGTDPGTYYGKIKKLIKLK